MNPNDQTRRQMLEYFYNRNSGATSKFGKKGSAVKISDAKRDLKALHSLSQQQVMSNLTYLVDRGWVKTIDIEKTVKVSGGTIPSTVTWYEVTALGIDKMEGGSEFQPKERYPGINITATGENVITLGDGNVVNASFSDLHGELSELKEAVAKSVSLSEAEKLNLSVDIESIKDQLAKERPNKGIVGVLWSSIKAVAVTGGFVETVRKLEPLIAGLLR